MTFDLSLSESAGSRSLHRLVRRPSLPVCKTKLCHLQFLNRMISPKEDCVSSNDESLDLTTATVMLAEVTAPVWIRAELPKERKQLLTIISATLTQEIENLPAQINLILDRYSVAAQPHQG